MLQKNPTGRKMCSVVSSRSRREGEGGLSWLDGSRGVGYTSTSIGTLVLVEWDTIALVGHSCVWDKTARVSGGAHNLVSSIVVGLDLIGGV